MMEDELQVQQNQQVQQVQQVQQNQQVQQVQQVQQTPYYVQQNITDYSKDRRNESMKSSKLQSVRKAVLEVMPQAYTQIDQIRAAPDVDLRHTVLHHSRGTQLTTNGKDKVLEFDIAGSSFKQFRSDYMGLKGKSSSVKGYMRTHIPLFFKLFSLIPGCRNHFAKKAKEEAKQNLSALNRGLIQQDELSDDQKYNVEILKKWYGRFGKSQEIEVNGTRKKYKHIRKVEKENKTRITMAGPLSMSGMRNSGEYSIENLSEYMLIMGKDYLNNILSAWQLGVGTQEHDIWLRIRGHSRGAVASIEGAMKIKQWVHENYPKYEHRVKFDLTQFDPVPGYGSKSGTHEKIDLVFDTAQQLGEGMKALGNSAETTVVYSMHTEHSHFFTPQQVEHTKRIVLVPFAHSVGLGEVDRQESSQQGKAHRATFTDAQSGEAYRIGSLNELDEGVYVLDENKTLIRLQSTAQWENIQAKVLQQVKSQAERHHVITEVIRTWFASHARQGVPNAAGANDAG